MDGASPTPMPVTVVDPIEVALQSFLTEASPADEQYFQDNGQRRHYAILGVNGEEGDTKTATVRMFVGDTVVDEEFSYPPPLTPEQQLEPTILARVVELGSKL